MKKTSPLNYIFGVAKIRTLEKFLINKEVFEEAIESGLNEALRLFAESELYSDEILHIRNSQQLEEVLNQELLKLKKLVSDLLLDKSLINLIKINSLEEAQLIVKDYNSLFLNDYIIHLIDMHNIKTFLRLHVLAEPKEKLEGLLTCEGFIRKKTFLELYGQDLGLFLNRLEYVHKHDTIVNYVYFLGEGIQYLEKEKSFIRLEKLINDFLIEVLKPAKYLSFGPEPILAYYFAKVNEINLIRIVILAKLNSLSLALIKDMV